MPRKAKAPEAAAVWTPVGSLIPWEDNPRPADNSESAARVAASIERFGFAAPIVARKANGMIIAGHTRYEAATEHLGLASVPVRFMDLDDKDARLLALADNRLQALGLTDEEALARVLRAMEEDELDLHLAGYSADDLDAILGRLDPSDVDDPGALPLPDDPDSIPGEVYLLGPHRLLCGDATDEGAIATATDGELADLVWTDPPYGVRLHVHTDAQAAKDAYLAKRRKDLAQVPNDDLDQAGLEALLGAAFKAAFDQCRPGASWYVTSPAGTLFDTFAGILGPRGLGVWRWMLVWAKDRIVLGRMDYHSQHEPIFYGWKPGAAHHGVADRSATSVFSVKRPGASPEHPTMKPVELIEPMITNSTHRNALVLDPFGGSGSTLIAAAKTSRRAALVELDPGYCDVIRRRWTAWARAAGVEPGPGALE